MGDNRQSRQKNRWKEKIIDIFGLPREVLLDLPRLVMLGNYRLIVENHRGLLEYTETMVRIRTARTEIKISGECLSLMYMIKEEIGLEGKFTCIELPGGEE